MESSEFTPEHFNQMLAIEEDYRNLSFEDLKTKTFKGAEIVKNNGGFGNLDNILEENEMLEVAAFINYRLAKRDLGEFIQEIDT